MGTGAEVFAVGYADGDDVDRDDGGLDGNVVMSLSSRRVGDPVAAGVVCCSVVGDGVTSTGAVRLFDNIHTPTPTVADTMTTKAGVRHIARLAMRSLFVFCFVAMIGSWWAASVVWSSTAMAVGMTTT